RTRCRGGECMNLPLPHHATTPCYGCGGKVLFVLLAKSRRGALTAHQFCPQCGTVIVSRPAAASFLRECLGNSSPHSRFAYSDPDAVAGYILKPQPRRSVSSSPASIDNSTGAIGRAAGIAAANGQLAKSSTKTDASICIASSPRRPATCTA